MSKYYEFLKECGSFFLLTNNNNVPTGRPFGAIMEVEDKLYITTSDEKAVYAQMKLNNNVQIVAQKAGTRQWCRITGKAKECFDCALKEKMLIECPQLKKYHQSGNSPHFNLFEILVTDSEMH